MKILVLGHSDSDGSRLADSARAWPWLLRDWLGERGVQVEVIHRVFFASPGCVRFLERQLAEHQPDVVILATSTYGAVIQLISNRVRELLGERAAHVVQRVEDRVNGDGRKPRNSTSRLVMLGRRAARRAIGTRATYPVESLIGWYLDCYRRLAREEQVHTIVLAGVGYGSSLQRLNPRLNTLQDTANRRFEAAAAEYHFDFLVHEELLGGREAKAPFYLPDEVHTNEEAQRLAAMAMLPLLMKQAAIIRR